MAVVSFNITLTPERKSTNLDLTKSLNFGSGDSTALEMTTWMKTSTRAEVV
jgi:hypothetical protein